MNKRLILNNIKSHYKFKTDSEFARFLGINSQNIRNWYNRNHYNANLLIEKCPDISPVYIVTGEGSMLKSEEQSPSLDEDKLEWQRRARLWMKIAEERLDMINLLKENIKLLKERIEKLEENA